MHDLALGTTPHSGHSVPTKGYEISLGVANNFSGPSRLKRRSRYVAGWDSDRGETKSCDKAVSKAAANHHFIRGGLG